MDRSAQEPPEPAGAADSPLSFPVEAPKLAGVEPGAGAPVGSAAEAILPRQGDPLAFPSAATPPPTPPPGAPLPFPVAELPKAAAAPQPAPGPAPTPAPGPTAETAASRLPRTLPAVLATLAALLAVGGCFLPLFQMLQELDFRQGFGVARLTVTETAWGTRIGVSGQEPTDRPGVPFGIPVIVAVALLAAAAFAGFSRPDRGLTRWLLSAGAVFAAGVVTTIGMSRFELSAIAGEELNLEVSTGPGMWLLVLATLSAAAAAVLAHLPLRRPGWADPAVAYADTPTPPSGVAITVLPPDEPGDPPLR
ncbi:hypothetical protein [Amycolatopsis rifamycinica]|uniref:Uncharacterized protein n=1 Tax=Amycolatopsis rifamycinica TaxID=287986 RepID=A0A066U9I6_9PSEU|nr:hypothetical protein [Amycolatopsis rifamycinica]KDN20764.1 hypothetical protein DV20_18935 [Amycolatopsis rifamycinica]